MQNFVSTYGYWILLCSHPFLAIASRPARPTPCLTSPPPSTRSWYAFYHRFDAIRTNGTIPTPMSPPESSRSSTPSRASWSTTSVSLSPPLSSIDKILERGEKLDIIVDKSEALADTADVFSTFDSSISPSCSRAMPRLSSARCWSREPSSTSSLLPSSLYAPFAPSDV